jgi:hypothetical protein
MRFSSRRAGDNPAVATSPHRHVQRASRELVAVAREKSDTHRHLKNRLLAIFWVTVAMAIFFSVVVYFAEHNAKGSQIHTVPDAFLFTISQLFTASSVDAPTTRGVQVLEFFFDLYAIFVVAALAGSFGAFFHRRTEEMREKAKLEAKKAEAAAGKAEDAAARAERAAVGD